jgi:hypothetical protein
MCPCYVYLCHCNMAYPRTAVEGDQIYILKVAGWKYTQYAVADSRKWGLLQVWVWARGLKILSLKKKLLVTEWSAGPRTWTDSLERTKQHKMDIKFVMWDVRSLHRAVALIAIASELTKPKSCLRICHQEGPRKWSRFGIEWGISAIGLCWWC